jgi:hypothetical protein
MKKDMFSYVSKVIIGDLNTYDGDNGIPSKKLKEGLEAEDFSRLEPPVVPVKASKSGKTVKAPAPSKHTDYAYLVPGSIKMYGQYPGISKVPAFSIIPVPKEVTDHERIFEFNVAITVAKPSIASLMAGITLDTSGKTGTTIEVTV